MRKINLGQYFKLFKQSKGLKDIIKIAIMCIKSLQIKNLICTV